TPTGARPHSRRDTAPGRLPAPTRPRPAPTISPPVPPCPAGAADIAARGRTCRAAATAETNLPRVATDRVAHARDEDRTFREHRNALLSAQSVLARVRQCQLPTG